MRGRTRRQSVSTVVMILSAPCVQQHKWLLGVLPVWVVADKKPWAQRWAR